MAKTRDLAIGASDLSEYLETQDDFNLELFVYHTAKKLGFTASHGGTYEDPVTKKARQYDVRAHIRGGDYRIDLAIECKSLKSSYPLLLSRIPRSPAESFHELIVSYESMSRLAEHVLCPAKVLRLVAPDSMYRPEEFVGKATAQVGRSERGDFVTGDSDIYDKWSQALASAHELAMGAIRHHETYDVPTFTTLVLPILVVADNTLWAADYSEDGVLQGPAQQVDNGLLFVDRLCSERMTIGYTISHLHILTRSSVPKLLGQIANDGGEAFWRRAFPKNVIARRLAKGD